ncbi:unnamed protein product [Chrysoparadoxa australica]
MDLPSLDHFDYREYDQFYEPSEDTYLLVDALGMDKDSIAKERPTICLEIGPGSGVVITSLALLLSKSDPPCHPLYLAIDLNANAAQATMRTAEASKVVSLEAVCGDLFSPLQQRLCGAIDVLIFNPPYVPTPPEEVGSTGIEAAWAGRGERGREVIDRVLPQVSAMLSSKGVFYLVVVQENDPADIIQVMSHHGLIGKVSLMSHYKNNLMTRPNVSCLSSCVLPYMCDICTSPSLLFS